MSLLSKTIVTDAFVTPAWPCLYTSSWRFAARTWLRFEIPSTKQMLSRMFDLPDPFRPVIALNSGSNPDTTVRVAYDLNPSMITSRMCMLYRRALRVRLDVPRARLLFRVFRRGSRRFFSARASERSFARLLRTRIDRLNAFRAQLSSAEAKSFRPGPDSKPLL